MGRAHEVRAKAMAATAAKRSALFMRASKEIYIAAKSGVMSIPSFIVFKNGEVLNSSTGAMSQANLAKMLDDAL